MSIVPSSVKKGHLEHWKWRIRAEPTDWLTNRLTDRRTDHFVEKQEWLQQGQIHGRFCCLLLGRGSDSRPVQNTLKIWMCLRLTNRQTSQLTHQPMDQHSRVKSHVLMARNVAPPYPLPTCKSKRTKQACNNRNWRTPSVSLKPKLTVSVFLL